MIQRLRKIWRLQPEAAHGTEERTETSSAAVSRPQARTDGIGDYASIRGWEMTHVKYKRYLADLEYV